MGRLFTKSAVAVLHCVLLFIFGQGVQIRSASVTAVKVVGAAHYQIEFASVLQLLTDPSQSFVL